METSSAEFQNPLLPEAIAGEGYPLPPTLLNAAASGKKEVLMGKCFRVEEADRDGGNGRKDVWGEMECVLGSAMVAARYSYLVSSA